MSLLNSSSWIIIPYVMNFIDVFSETLLSIPTWYPISYPTFVWSYSLTRCAKLMAANLLGSHTAILAFLEWWKINLGTCVDLPQPVLPLMTMALWFYIACIIYYWCSKMGSAYFCYYMYVGFIFKYINKWNQIQYYTGINDQSLIIMED